MYPPYWCTLQTGVPSRLVYPPDWCTLQTGVSSRLVYPPYWCTLQTGVPSRLVYPQDWCTLQTGVPSRLVYPPDWCILKTGVPFRLVIYIFMSPSDPVNRRSLDIIEQGIFFLGLDTPREEVNSVKHDIPYLDSHGTTLINRYFHGSGTNVNSGNRWFDTTMQVLCGVSIAIKQFLRIIMILYMI